MLNPFIDSMMRTACQFGIIIESIVPSTSINGKFDMSISAPKHISLDGYDMTGKELVNYFLPVLKLDESMYEIEYKIRDVEWVEEDYNKADFDYTHMIKYIGTGD